VLSAFETSADVLLQAVVAMAAAAIQNPIRYFIGVLAEKGAEQLLIDEGYKYGNVRKHYINTNIIRK
jgi:hypothetical protein